MRTKRAVLVFCLFFVKTALRLVSRDSVKEVENVIRVDSNTELDAGRRCQHVEISDVEKPLLGSGGNEELVRDCFRKKIVENESNSSFSEAVLYKNRVTIILLRQRAVSSGQDVLFSSQDVARGTGHRPCTLQG